MWNRPNLLNAIADALYLIAGSAILAVCAVGVMRVSAAPVRQVELKTSLAHVQAAEVEDALDGILGGNFLTLNLDVVRAELEKLPWVRRADVRRHWPAKLEVRLEEQKAAARWGEGRGELVNGFGEVFVANIADDEGKALPILFGPPNTAPQVISLYQQAQEALGPLGLETRQVILSQRLAWQIKLADGLQVYLGREQPKVPVAQRLQAFTQIYPNVIARREPRPLAVDMRYPNGVAIRMSALGLRP
jgi:cell division protein FtsQ